MSNLKEDIEVFQKIIGSNIERIRTRKGLSQKEVRVKCEDAGFPLSQSTISNVTNGGNATIGSILAIAYALDVNVVELFDTSSFATTETAPSDEVNALVTKGQFVTDAASDMLKGYMGDFHTLFYKTSGAADELVRGTMHIGKNGDGEGCIARLTLHIDEIDPSTGKPAEKIYSGPFFESQSMRACYFLLVNEQTSEVSMIITQHIYTTYNKIATIMGLAITTASGANRLPTVHRISLSREKIDGEKLESVKGQLLMNTTDIIMDLEQIEEIWKDNTIPLSFRELLYKTYSKYPCFCIPEASLYDSSLTEEEQDIYISRVRAVSKSPKYSKISRKTDDILFSLAGKKRKHKPNI